MAQTVIGIFDSREAAENAVERLTQQGFTSDDIDIASHGYTGNSYGDTLNTGSSISDSTTGTSSDSTIGSSSSGYGSADTNDRSDDSFGEKVSGFFKNLFGDNDEYTEKYATVGRKGTIVSVYAQSRDEAERAADILDEYGAVNVDERASQYSSMNSGDDTIASGNLSTSAPPDLSSRTFRDLSASVDSDSDTSSYRTADDESTLATSTNTFSDEDDSTLSTRTNTLDDDESRTSIPVVEEELQVGKREVERGGVRVRSRIIERPVEESLRLREEHVRVDRTAVNRPATEADFDTFREGEIEVRERAEVPVVNKEARVVEEVNVRRDVEERDEVVRDTVRRTDVEVEPLDSDLDLDTDVSTSKTKSRKKK